MMDYDWKLGCGEIEAGEYPELPGQTLEAGAPSSVGFHLQKCG